MGGFKGERNGQTLIKTGITSNRGKVDASNPRCVFAGRDEWHVAFFLALLTGSIKVCEP